MLDRVVVRYDLERFPFPAIVEKHVGHALPLLHETYSYDRLRRGTEQHTELHALLYEVGPVFHETYRRFLHEVVRPLLGDDLVFQRIPNFRFQLPGNVAVRGFHRDREDGHQAAEINCWVPLTPVDETSAVWMETWEGAGNHAPAVVQPGELLVFDGSNLEHGNQVNASATTRVSFDFRVARRSVFLDSPDRSMYRDVSFRVGDYFDVLGQD
jgi:hypothetical protein